MQPMIFERVIAATVGDVWSIMTDVNRYAERFSEINAAVLLTAGGFEVGTRWCETRTVYGRCTTVEIHVAEVELRYRYVIEARVGARAISEFRFTPTDHGKHTVVRVTFQTVGGSPFYRFAELLGRRRIRRCVVQNNTQDLADLERACGIGR